MLGGAGPPAGQCRLPAGRTSGRDRDARGSRRAGLEWSPVPAAPLLPDQRDALERLLASTPVVDELAARFTDAGHELALVGGPVRDALLGRLGTDWDFATSATPEETEQLLRGWSDAIWDMGRRFGTIGGRKAGVDLEITTYRQDTYDPDSRKPDVAYGDSLEGDLSRRDFTVNAMALHVRERRFVDPYGGLADLGAGLLRTPSTPEQSFSDDPLRMMRAARFAAQLGFRPDEGVVAAMSAMAERITIISAERVRDELVKLLCASSPRAGLTLLVDTGLADRVLPEVPAMRLTRDEHHRHKDVYEHSLTVLEQAIELEPRIPGVQPPDFVVRFAALMHDVGKPRTRRFTDDGQVTFHHHDVVGAKMTAKRMKALRFSTEQVKAVSELVALHLRFHGYGSGEWTDSAVRRYVRDAGPYLERLHVLTRADCTTRNQRKAARLQRTYDDLERRIAELAEQEEMAAVRPDLDGNQIMQLLGLPPGREVGEAYRHLLELRLDRGPLGADEAEAELRRWWAERQG
jgi:poly(A) polymerase